MKKKYNRYKLTNKFLSGILVLLGFSSCSNDEDEPIICEYGTPIAIHEIKGKVTDENKNDLNGIQVIVKKIIHEDHAFPIDTLKTDAQGKFDITTYGGRAEEEYRVVFHDIDGEDNGGTFKSDSVNVKTIKTEDGDGNWNNGTGEAEINITLTKTSTLPSPEEE